MKNSIANIASIAMIVAMGALFFGTISRSSDAKKGDNNSVINSIEDGYVNNTKSMSYTAQPDSLVTATTTSTTTTTTVTTTTTTEETTTEPETTTTTTTTTLPAEHIELEIPAEPEEVKPYYYYGEWVWIGDSRTVGLSNCVSIDSFAKGSMGLNWFIENSETIYAYRYKTIVINLGVNDLGNVWNYVNAFNNMPDEFIQNNCIYIMSVNPVDEAMERRYGYSVRNESIEFFNDNLRDNLREELYFMDCYNYLQNIGFSTADGVHYTYNTYVDIYNYMITSVIGDTA